MTTTTIAALLLSVAVGGVGSARADSCTTGTYETTVAPLLKMVANGGNRIALRDGRIHIEGCPGRVRLSVARHQRRQRGEGLGVMPQLDVWEWQYVDADPTCSASP